ncbi:MAG: CoA-binding protein [Candidatus Diapherotrites archaeon]|nr:CoA-binding protein [Candidatus Diapherotrites archaeon]
MQEFTGFRVMHALDCFFNPQSIAFIGASREPGKVGYVVLQNFIRNRFKGKLYPVNPNAQTIQSLQSYPSVKKAPGEVDLAIITVPGPAVPQVVSECVAKKVKGVCIISAGFSEVGNEVLTKQLQREMEKGLKQGTRFIGPNCLGVLDTQTKVDMLFLPQERLGRPGKGVVSFISQSGALGSAILDWDALKGYGINKFVSYGNAMDIDEADLLEYLGEDPGTKAIVLYLEGAKQGRKFFETAKKVSAKKPIIAIKGGVTEQGGHAVTSHTGSLAGAKEVYEAAFRQANIVYAHSMEEVFAFARTFTTEPVPKGKRVQVITNGGGYGVLATDALIQNGLELAQLNPKTLKELQQGMPSHVVLKNPLDLTGDADNMRFKRALEMVLQDANVDMVLLIMLFQVPTLNELAVRMTSTALRERKKPVIVLSVGGKYAESHKMALEQSSITTFSSPSESASSLRALYEYYARRGKA